MTARLNVNIDHVATIREARKTIEPSIITAAVMCEQAGANGITVHLRQDRRHIQDRDIELLRDVVTTYLNVEMAATDEMIDIAEATRPDAVSLVPENANEVTTEGGLDVVANFDNVGSAVERLKNASVFVSIFIDPDADQIEASKRAGAQQVELCTGGYAELTLSARAAHGEG
nr:pyridoxine 5'-phosphate synthase [Blastocatellia bacterium]